MFIWLSQRFSEMMGIGKRTSPPDQACLVIRFLGGWVKAQKNQLVILIGMIQAKLRGDYSTQVGEAQAGFGGRKRAKKSE
jgi:hypothetical protein